MKFRFKTPLQAPPTPPPKVPGGWKTRWIQKDLYWLFDTNSEALKPSPYQIVVLRGVDEIDDPVIRTEPPDPKP